MTNSRSGAVAALTLATTASLSLFLVIAALVGIRLFSSAQMSCSECMAKPTEPERQACMPTSCNSGSSGGNYSSGGSYSGSGCPKKDCYNYCHDDMCKSGCDSMSPDPASCSTSGGSTGGSTSGTSGGSSTTTTTVPEPPAPKYVTPELLFTNEVDTYIKALQQVPDVLPCNDERLISKDPEIKQWREENPNFVAILTAMWEKDMYAAFRVPSDKKFSLAICPSIRELALMGADTTTASCKEAAEDAANRVAPALAAGEKTEEEVFKLLTGAYENHVEWDPSCPSIDMGALKEYVKDRGGKVETCKIRANGSFTSCPQGYACIPDSEKEVPVSRARGFMANLLGAEDLKQWECTKLESGECSTNEDCPESTYCQYGPQPMVVCDPAVPSTCRSPVGQCVEAKLIVDPPFIEEEEEREEMKEGEVEDCRPLTRDMVKSDFIEEGVTDFTVQDIEEAYGQWVDEYLAENGYENSQENRAKFDACTLGEEDDDEGEHEAASEVAPEELATLFSRAISMFLGFLQHSDKLPDSFVALVRSATDRFGGMLKELASGEPISVVEAMRIAQEVRKAAPEELRDIVVDEEREEEWRGEVQGDMRRLIQDVAQMVGPGGWIDKVLVALDEAGHPDAGEWRTYLEEAQEAFFKEGGVQDQILASAQRGTFEDIGRMIEEKVFGKLMVTMKEGMEGCMPQMGMMFGGNEGSDVSRECKIVMEVMMKVGEPPMMGDERDHGGPGGPGGPGGSAEDLCSNGDVQRIFDLTDQMPEAAACLEEETPECEGVIDEYDRKNARKLFGQYGDQMLDAFNACVAAYEGHGDFDGGSDHDWRRDVRMQEEECYRVSNEAGLTACRMQQGATRVGMSEVDRVLASWGAEGCINVHPADMKVAGVDFDCPENVGHDRGQCDGPWNGLHKDCERYGYMDPHCVQEHLKHFPDQCKPDASDPIWNIGQQWQQPGTGGGEFARTCYSTADGIIECEEAWDESGQRHTSCYQHNVGDSSWRSLAEFQDVGSVVSCPGMGGWTGGGGTGGGMAGWERICATWNNGAGQQYDVELRCKDDLCDDAGMKRPRSVYTNFRQCRDGSGWTGGGGIGASGCFWTDVTEKETGRSAGFTVHRNTDGSDPRYGDPSGKPIDGTKYNFGTAKNCYGPEGGGYTGGGGGWPSGNSGCEYPSATWRNDNTKGEAPGTPVTGLRCNDSDTAMADCSFTKAGTTVHLGSNARAQVNPGPYGNCSSWAAGGGWTTGGSSSSYPSGGGTYGSCPGPDWPLVTWQKGGGMTETTCVGPNVTQAEIDTAKANIARDCPQATSFYYPNPTRAAEPSAGVPFCPMGGTTGGGSSSSWPSGSSSSPSGAATGMPAPGCSYSWGTLTNGTTVTYASCPQETPNTCNTSAGTVSYNDLRVPAPNACASGTYQGGSSSSSSWSSSSSSSSMPLSCPSNKWSFAQATRPDGSAIPPFTCQNGVCNAGEPLDGINWGPSTCVSASGGIFYAIGTFIRSIAGF